VNRAVTHLCRALGNHNKLDDDQHRKDDECIGQQTAGYHVCLISGRNRVDIADFNGRFRRPELKYPVGLFPQQGFETL